MALDPWMSPLYLSFGSAFLLLSGIAKLICQAHSHSFQLYSQPIHELGDAIFVDTCHPLEAFMLCFTQICGGQKQVLGQIQSRIGTDLLDLTCSTGEDYRRLPLVL